MHQFADVFIFFFFFFSSRRRHTRLQGDWSSDVCSSDLEPEALAVAEIETLPIATVEPVPLPMASAAAELEAVSAAMAHLPGALRGQEGRGAGLAVWARLPPDTLSARLPSGAGTLQRWPLWISAVGVLLAWGVGFWFFSGGVARKTSLPTSPDSRSTVKAVVSEPPLAGTGQLSSEEQPTVVAEAGERQRQIFEAGLGRSDSKWVDSVHALAT